VTQLLLNINEAFGLIANMLDRVPSQGLWLVAAARSHLRDRELAAGCGHPPPSGPSQRVVQFPCCTPPNIARRPFSNISFILNWFAPKGRRVIVDGKPLRN
jgi:hypothetical protein